jgi:hypothetical protein
VHPAFTLDDPTFDNYPGAESATRLTIGSVEVDDAPGG